MWAQKQTGHWLHGHVPLQLGALIPKYWKEKIYKGLSAMCIFKKLVPSEAIPYDVISLGPTWTTSSKAAAVEAKDQQGVW